MFHNHKSIIAEILSKTPLLPGELATAVTLLIFIFSAVFTSRFSRIHNKAAITVDSTTVIYIKKPENLKGLNALLDTTDIHFDKVEFDWVAQMLGWRRFQIGRYEISKDYSYNAFLKKLAYGIQDPVRVTILPGLMEDRFVSDVSRYFKFNGNDLWKAMHDTTLLDSLGVPEKDIFGRMLPNTYRFYWTSTPGQFLQKMLSEFKRDVTLRYQDRLSQLKMPVDKIVTLASIIEWEAKDPNEKPKISGLYWNRLKKGWLLQADPTINFIIGDRRRLLYKDYQIKNPYNTYLYRGLPPGPITNPSMGSIRAALFPQDNDYMYMVATPSGDHAFSKTYAEHLKKSAKWRRWIRKQYRIKREKEREEKQSKR